MSEVYQHDLERVEEWARRDNEELRREVAALRLMVGMVNRRVRVRVPGWSNGSRAERDCRRHGQEGVVISGASGDDVLVRFDDGEVVPVDCGHCDRIDHGGER